MKNFSVDDEQIFAYSLLLAIPVIFIYLCLRLPVISCDIAPLTEALPGGPIHPKSYYLYPENTFIASQSGIDLPYLALWSLVGVIFIQMLSPGKKQYLLYDIGINLLISAAITLLWIDVNTPLLDGLARWDPHIMTYIPLIGLLLVPFQRIMRSRDVKNKG